MITINYNGKQSRIIIAVQHANQLLQNKEFYQRIAAHDYFNLSDLAPYFIAVLIKKTNIDMSIKFYYPNPGSKAHSFDDIANPRNIQFNVRNIERSIPSLCNTMIHACVHAVNAAHSGVRFDHDGLPEDKARNTAPYWIGNLAQKMISGDETNNDLNIHETNIDPESIFECLVLPVS